jgi:hypothetical protein
MQQELELLKVDISSRKDRLHQSGDLNSQDPNGIFTMWASLLLSAFIDRNWSYLYYPLSLVRDKHKWEGTLDR